jgi:hypothetical protein
LVPLACGSANSPAASRSRLQQNPQPATQQAILRGGPGRRTPLRACTARHWTGRRRTDSQG